MTLYHYTCQHGRDGLGERGHTQPTWHPLIGVSLTWFTDLETPHREILGLTSDMLKCDRTQYRYRVVNEMTIAPWLGSCEQSRTDPHTQADLHRFSDPAHWWFSTTAVLVELDSA